MYIIYPTAYSLDQVSPPSLRGRLIEYQPVWFGLGGVSTLVAGGK